MAEYTCSVCKERFEDKEKELTQDEHKCILHCEKNCDEWKEKESKLFWEKLNNKINNKTNEALELPEFQKLAREENQEFSEYIFKDIYFPSHYNISPFYYLNDELDKSKNEHLNLIFNNCHFIGTTNFNNIFKAKDITFVECHFYNDITIVNQTFENIFLFESCTVYKSIKFQNINFFKLVSFIKTKFMEKVDFIHTKFYDLALFNECKLGNIEFDNTFFNAEANFLNLQNEVGKKLESKNIENRETARIIKDSFEKQNNIIEANKFYELEMKKREDELAKEENKSWFELLIFKIHGISSNHSQDAFLALFWIFTITFFYETLKNIEMMYFPFIIISYLTLITFLFEFKNEFKFFIISISIILIFYITYGISTNDFQLFCVANTMNPFAIMTGTDELNFINLVYRAFIAYLIYQFIVSIRQNTRRK